MIIPDTTAGSLIDLFSVAEAREKATQKCELNCDFCQEFLPTELDFYMHFVPTGPYRNLGKCHKE